MIPTSDPLALTKKLVKQAGTSIVWNYPILSLPWARVKNSVEYTNEVPTWAINCITGRIAINPQWTASTLSPAKAEFAIGHELLHVLLNQFERATRVGAQAADGSPIPGKERNHQIFWESADRVINQMLVNDGIGEGVPGMLMPEPGYSGPLETEAYYHWAMKQPPKPPQPQQGGAKNAPKPLGQGCQPQGKAPNKDDGQGQPQNGQGQQGQSPSPSQEQIDWNQVRREAQAMASEIAQKGIGKGTCIAEALKPKRATTDWRKILPNAFDMANAEASSREHRSYARASRRQNTVEPNIMLPGKVGADPTIAVVFDVSGSVSRELVAKSVGQVQKLASQYPQVNVFVAAHTSECVWSGFIKKGGDEKTLIKATSYSGGTDCRSTYEKVREAFGGECDVLVHFTDCELPGWPEVPAKRVVVGACGLGPTQQPYAKPPKNQRHVKFIPIDIGDGRSNAR